MFRVKFGKCSLFGAALLCAALPAFASEESGPGVAPVASLPHATVNCPGISSVPMTADAEQSLPMHVVAMLACQEPVVILADNEGYTSRVRLSDGTEGYVARMYLAMNGTDHAVALEVQPTSATVVNNVVRWQAGAPGCDQFSVKGYTVESATANGLTVQVSLQDSGWKLRATIAISNEAGKTIEVLPALVTLDELEPGLKPLLALDPAKLSHVVNHEVLWTQANAQPSPSAHFSEAHVSTVSYKTSSQNIFIDHSVPVAANTREQSAPATSELNSLALKHSELASGQKTTGVIWFQRDPNARELSLRVPVGGLVFDFPLSFNQKK
ncbi:MAG TPA: hypothetical protein VKH45_12475 [Candidatus Acidoferrum sp.]|nr:hypothetical protein [Candidatus Acidoferrum sp.]